MRRISSRALEAHLQFLGSAALEGRRIGTPGARIAARYIASQLEASGLAPVLPDSTYLQPIALIAARAEPTLRLRADGGAELDLRAGVDYLARTTAPVESVTVAGDLVFVGRGISGSEGGPDDYGGADLAGKVALALSLGSQPGGSNGDAFEHALRAHQIDAAARHGAAAIVFVETWPEALTTAEDIPPGDRELESMYLADGRADGGVRVRVSLSPGSVRRLLDIAGLRLETLVESAMSGTFRPIDIGAAVEVTVRNRLRALTEFAAVGRLAPREGEAGQGAREALIIAAHYDGPEIGAFAAADSMERYRSAAGAAALLTLADAFAAMRPRPTRPVLFIALSGRRSGFVGARQYARRPLIPPERTALAVQIDLEVGGSPDQVAVLGDAIGGVQRLAAAAADAEGLTLLAERFSSPIGSRVRPPGFAESGIPTLHIGSGSPLSGDGEDGSVDLTGLMRQGRFAFRLARGLSREDLSRPPEASGAGEMQARSGTWRGGGEPWCLPDAGLLPILALDFPARGSTCPTRFIERWP